MAMYGTWDHDNPNITLAVTLEPSTNSYTATLKSGSGWVQGVSKYGYKMVIYAGASYDSKSAIITLNERYNNASYNSINLSSGTMSYPSNTTHLGFWVECGAPGCSNSNPLPNTRNEVISFDLYKAPSGLSASIEATSGTTLTFKFSWTDGSVASTIHAQLQNSNGNNVGSEKTTTINGGTLKFTGLSTGTTYKVIYYLTDGTTRLPNSGTSSVSAKTYKAIISVSKRSATTIKINSFGYTTGSVGSNPSKMHYAIYDNSGSTLIVSEANSPINSTNIVISGLSSNTTYKVKYWLDSPTDTVEWASVTTGLNISGLSFSVTASTGTTITCTASWNQNDALSSSCTIEINGTHLNVTNGGSVKFTGLTTGTAYTVNAVAEDTEGGRLTASSNATTYKIDIVFGNTTTKTQEIRFTIITGESGDKSNSMKFRIKKSSESTYWDIQTGSSSFTKINGYSSGKGFSPNTTYDVQYYIDGLKDENGNFDTVRTAQFTTKAAVSNLKFENVSITGTTTLVKVSWSANGSTGIVANISVNGISRETSTNGDTLLFTGLINGTQYTISGSAKDDEDNTVTGSSISFTTYKVGITVEDTSTRAAKYKLQIIAGPNATPTIDYTCSTSSTTTSPSTATSGNSKITDNLVHNTSYIITAWIDNMKDENGNLDTKVVVSFTTKELTLQYISSRSTQHAIITEWQAYANGIVYDKCQLTNNAITFIISECSNTPKATSGYQTTNITGSVSGSYKTLRSTDLCYYAYYTIKCVISDGKNKAQALIILHTDFPYSYINNATNFRKAIPYIYTSSGWQKAPVFINNGVWRESNGE